MSSIANFLVLKKLGEGSFSEVYEVQRKSDGAKYAMKKVKMGKLSSKEKENALNEIRILASINHPNVIGFKEGFFEDSSGCLCIVMEHADAGDMLQKINAHKKNNTNFTEKQLWHYFIQTVRGLKALHDLKICHRDIKCANLFLTKEGVVKLGDLNVSKVAKRGLLRTQTGTPYYACPEVWKDMPYDFRSDIWSMGCVLYEMAMKQPPFRASTMKGLYAKVIAGKYEPISPLYSQDFKNIIKQCLQVRATERPTCEKILAMPGLLNHLTGTLDDLDCAEPDDNPETLLKTIKLPRRMGQITERLPAPQYDVECKIKRTNSLPTSNSVKLITSEVKPTSKGAGRASPDLSSVGSGSPASQKSEPKRALANLANRAQRNMDLPVIEENVGGNEEEDTIRTNHQLYRPPQRAVLSRDNSVQRKNRGILDNAAIAVRKPPSGRLPHNYHSIDSNVIRSANVQKDIKLYRDLGSEPNSHAGDKDGRIPIQKPTQHDTKTPIILSQKARYMREQMEQKEGAQNNNHQLVLPRIQSTKVTTSQQNLSNLVGRLYSRESSDTRDVSALVNNNRLPSSQSRKYLMPNDILRNVRSSHQSLEPNPLNYAVPVSYQANVRAVSNHRNDLAQKRQLLGSRQESSSLAHVKRMRQHHMKIEAGAVDTENRYKYLYEPDYLSPDVRHLRGGAHSNNPPAVRHSLNVNKLSERAVEYDLGQKYKPSAQALQQYRLHDRQQLSSAAIGYHHSRANSNLQKIGGSQQQGRQAVISAAGLRELRSII